MIHLIRQIAPWYFIHERTLKVADRPLYYQSCTKCWNCVRIEQHDVWQNRQYKIAHDVACYTSEHTLNEVTPRCLSVRRLVSAL